MSYKFSIRKRLPRKVKRKGGVYGLQTDYEVLTVVATGKKDAKLLAQHLNGVVKIQVIGRGRGEGREVR